MYCILQMCRNLQLNFFLLFINYMFNAFSTNSELYVYIFYTGCDKDRKTQLCFVSKTFRQIAEWEKEEERERERDQQKQKVKTNGKWK